MRIIRRGEFGALLVAAILIMGIAVAGGASAGTLERIRQDRIIRLGYREDAPPFSYKNNVGEPAGFMVDLCRAVAKHLTQELQLPSLSVSYVVVTATDRFESIEQGKTDLLCEATSATLSRRELVDFSIPTYIDGASIMIRGDGPRDLEGLAGRKIGVLGGTTTEEALRNTLRESGIAAGVIVTKTHAEGVAMLDDGAISAYFADRDILTSLIAKSKAPQRLAIAENYLTLEPYALALPRGDDDFRLAVDRALSHFYRSGEIGPTFEHNFTGKPTGMLNTLYLISGLPD